MPNVTEEIETVRAEGGTTLFLLPEDITVIEAIHNLRGERDSQEYLKGIEEFANQIKEEGQIQNALVAEVPVEGGVEYHLIAGSRRRDAIAFNNAGLKTGEMPTPVRCTVLTGVNAIAMVRKALRENTWRENFTPMDLARDTESVKKLIKANGKDWSAKVADFMGVSRAQVTQHYKLLSLPVEVQEQIKAEGWSSQAAQDLLDVKPEKVVGVAKGATAKAKAEAKEKATTPATAPAPTPVAGKGKKKAEAEAEPEKGAEKGAKVKRAHVVKAAREADAFEKPKPVAKSEIVDAFDSIDGPAYGHENSPVRQFIQYFRDKFVPGIGSDKTLIKKFDAMVFNAAGKLYAGEGTPGKEAREEPTVKGKAAGGKK